MQRLILATHNEHKAIELRQMLRDYPLQVYSLKDLDFAEEIEENGESFEDNAALKRDALAKIYPHDFILADDSGLCVEALGGRPGIHTARYGGVNASQEEKFQKLWEELKASGLRSEEWRAEFVCCLALHTPDGRNCFIRGICKGKILPEVRGRGGFGYDPIFAWKEDRSLAELNPEEKNRISHRACALEGLRALLSLYFPEVICTLSKT